MNFLKSEKQSMCIIRGVLISFLFTICMLTIFSILLVYTNLSEETIKPLLENGYIELTEEVAKAYGDSFFQTKQGTNYNQIKKNTTSGSNYIRWFKSYTSNLSKTEDELRSMELLISSSGFAKSK